MSKIMFVDESDGLELELNFYVWNYAYNKYIVTFTYTYCVYPPSQDASHYQVDITFLVGNVEVNLYLLVFATVRG